MENITNIREPFYTAGKQFGWFGKAIGLGIDLKYFKGEGKIYATVGRNPQVWVIDKKVARQFVKRYNSYFNAHGTELGVIAWSVFKKEEEINESQKTLFE